jgi:muramoyltetrapeptide carboxypeptidase
VTDGRIAPPRLRPGDTIAVVSPSSAVRTKRFAAGVRAIEARGYCVRVYPHAHDCLGYLAGDDEARARDLQAALTDPDISMVLCSRGGYGACRLLDRIDWEAVAAAPRLFSGYSDITSLHLAFAARTRVPTLHGLMAASLGDKLSPEPLACFWAMVEGFEAPYLMPSAGAAVRTLTPGVAAGRLAGGCITILTASLGCWEAPDLVGKIVILEDVGEPVYRMDRYVTQLIRGAGLGRAAGIIIGNATGWQRLSRKGPTLDELWYGIIAPLGVPAVAGFPMGHEPQPLTFPLGCMARLDACAGTLTLLESPVS